MKNLTEDSLDLLFKAIDLASDDNLETVEIAMHDLLILKEHIQDIDYELGEIEKDNLILRYRLRLTNISLAKSELSRLGRPIKLDYYA